MCKYNNYKIEVVHNLTKNKEVINSEDSTNYTNMISLYKKVKERFLSEDVIINFVGVNESEERIIFKKINNTNQVRSKKIKNLIDTIVECSEELEKEIRNVFSDKALLEKEKSNVRHLMIESIKADSIEDKTKIEAFDEFRSVLLKKRDLDIIHNICYLSNNDTKEIVKRINKISKTYDEKIRLSHKITLDLLEEDSKFRDTHMIKEYPYKNDKERINLMKQLQSKYDKIINNEDRKILSCYNKCKGA